MKRTVLFIAERIIQDSIIIGIIFFASSCGIDSEKTITDNTLLPSSGTPIISTPFQTATILSSINADKTSFITPTSVLLDPKVWAHITLTSETSQPGIHQIAEAANGTMWFYGWDNGTKLYRYDINDWTIYDPKDIAAFHGKVSSIAIDSNGIIWAGTTMNEIVSFDGEIWTSQTVEEGGYRNNEIDYIVIRRNGELCAISIEGMSCKDKGKWAHYPIAPQNETNQIAVLDTILSPSDEVWISLSDGLLYHYDGKNWKSSQVSSWLGPIAIDQDGSLWIFDHEGLGKREASGNVTYLDIPAALWDYPVVTMYEMTSGDLWLGCLSGGDTYELVIYKKDGIFESADGKIMPNNLLYPDDQYPFGDVYKVFQSKDGSIWLGTANGVFHYNSNE